METIKSIIGTVLRDAEQRTDTNTEQLERAWVRATSKTLRQHTKLRYCKQRVLYVTVEDPGWLYAFRAKQDDILKKINKLSQLKIKNIRIRVGDINDN